MAKVVAELPPVLGGPMTLEFDFSGDEVRLWFDDDRVPHFSPRETQVADIRVTNAYRYNLATAEPLAAPQSIE